MSPETRYLIIRERLNVLFLLATTSCFTFIAGTAVGNWPIFIGISIVYIAFGLFDLKASWGFSSGDDFGSLIAGSILISMVAIFAFTQWQDEHPIRAAQTYAILGLFMFDFVGQSILGWESRRQKQLITAQT